MPTMIGAVSKNRYDELVAETRELFAQDTNIQFKIGDNALEIEPMRPRGGSQPAAGEDLHTVSETIAMFADDVGAAHSTVMMYRFVASKWPKQYRQPDVSLDIHRILIGVADPFEQIKDPPLHPRSGKRRWTQDAAKRLVGWQVSHPQSVQEKVEAIHDLAADEQVAARVATDFLRRPEVAFRAASDDTARHLFNKAQFDRSDQARERFERESPVAPVVRQLRHTVEFLDLVGACHSFVSSAGKVVPSLRGRPLSEDERAVLHKNVAKVRAAADWIEGAIDTGEVDMDEELARLLRGE